MGTDNELEQDPPKVTLFSKIKRIGKLGGAISGSVVAVITPIWLMFAEVRGRADAAQAGAEAGYETLAPVVDALQRDLRDGMQAMSDIVERLDQADSRLNQDRDKRYALEARITRCETYIEILSRGKYQLTAEPVEAEKPVADKPVPPEPQTFAEQVEKVLKPSPKDRVQQLADKQEQDIPKTLKKARAYQTQQQILEK